jgi:hypothetical protein
MFNQVLELGVFLCPAVRQSRYIAESAVEGTSSHKTCKETEAVLSSLQHAGLSRKHLPLFSGVHLSSSLLRKVLFYCANHIVVLLRAAFVRA